VYGDVGQGQIKTDFLFRHNIHNVYKVDDEIVKAVSNKFPFVNSSHQYSLLPDVVGLAGNKLHVIFYQNKCVVVCCKQNQLHLIQQFDYTNAQDAAYYLLAIVQQHKMDVNEMAVVLSGMINENSTLYIELHKYFKHLSFATLPTSFNYVTDIETLPSHYFAHLFSIAACV
jgi:hydrogenase maturation factor HypF (carbamoyltransferase family)